MAVMEVAPSDAAVIAASVRDVEQFGVLYDRYAFRRLGAEGAEEVVAETFSVAFGQRHRYDPARADARPWLFGILTREIAQRRRAEDIRYRALLRSRPDGPVPGPEERVADGVTAQAARGPLLAALSTVKPADRDVLLLIAWGDLSYAEVADALDIPVGTVRSRLSRARRIVRAALGGTDPTDVNEES
jgi:RNA polymerase sigma factor (sigma-70 family)